MSYLDLIAYYESFYARYGDNFQGVGWTKGQEDTDTRYQVMLDIIRVNHQTEIEPIALLDFGCGLAHLYDYIQQRNLHHIRYSGLDIAPKFLAASRAKHPDLALYGLDILKDEDDVALPQFDYIVLNGLFTAKDKLSYDDMFNYMARLLPRVFAHANIGIAFNVMSKQVDWERDDLFHVPFDALASFLRQHLSRNFVFRHDYRLFEYTTYVYK